MKRNSLLRIPAERTTETGLPWLYVRIRDRTVSALDDIPGRWHALGDGGEVIDGLSFGEATRPGRDGDGTNPTRGGTPLTCTEVVGREGRSYWAYCAELPCCVTVG
jgi:hypothetical protein